MRFEAFVSFRYLVAKRREKFISLISLISILGIAIGVMALIVVIGVMSGFDNDLKNKIMGSSPDIIVQRLDMGRSESELIGDLLKIKHVKAVSPFFSSQAMVKFNDSMSGVMLRGIAPDSEVNVTRISEYVKNKPFELGEEEIILGNELAKNLGIRKSDEVYIYTASGKNPVKLKVVNFYNCGMYDIDSAVIFVHISQANVLYKTEGLSRAFAVKLDDSFLARSVASEILADNREYFSAVTWMESNRELFSALKLEKSVMFIILSLIVLVACFNIASTLTMMVMEKTKDIGILKAIGVGNGSVMRIFALEGFIIGLLGTLLGGAGGFGLCYILKKYNFIKLPQDIYYIDHLPVSVRFFDSFVIMSAALVLTLLACLYPAFKASRLKPVDALRCE